jgi:aminoglycoside phosphotransferase (APT) family kinase protein
VDHRRVRRRQQDHQAAADQRGALARQPRARSRRPARASPPADPAALGAARGEVEDPDFTIQREVTVLGLLATVPVPTPVVGAADPEGEVCYAPALLLERLPGRSLQRRGAPRRYLTQLGEALPPIHRRDGLVRELIPAYRTYQDLRGLRAPGWLGEPALWERAFAVAAGPAPDAGRCLIHRDYHPGNTLWWRGSLTGVVDWTQASWGPPGIDVGWMRWNLAWDDGLEAADEFLRL